MVRRSLEIIGSSFKMALQELWKNKLRTFLSLFGITIGIFCIIGVLATVSSLEKNIQNEVKSLGSNSIYIDKWEWKGGPDYPFWKYVNRPSPKYSELSEIKARTPSAQYAAFAINVQDYVEYEGSELSNVKIYGVTQDFEDIQSMALEYGRYVSDAEFDRGLAIAIMGNDVAEALFGSPELAVGREITVRGSRLQVAGIIKKQGKSMLGGGGWDFDQSIIIPYKFARTIMNETRAAPFIIVKGPEGLSSRALKEDLTGSMRAIHKLTPSKEDDFALNDINDISDDISEAFGAVNIGGWAIAGLSLIVGMFGVANIMFVSVRERTGQIGLKKAIGAKNRIILTEFLLESAFLCIIGGIIGLLLVFGLTQLLTSVFNFPVFISTTYMILAIMICIFVGILAGFIPALQAAKLDPVVAIRSK
jgi:putative ABC transport system permease protein